MEHYKINKSGEEYLIFRIGTSPALYVPVENKIINICVDVLFNWGRHKTIGLKFYKLQKKNEEVDLSEYELMKLIDIFLKQEWNLFTGRFLKQYYYSSYPQAKDELARMFPNGF